MISEQQQELASLYVLGALTPPEREAFEAELRTNVELRPLVLSLQRSAGLLAMAGPATEPPAGLRAKILQRALAQGTPASSAVLPPEPGIAPGLRFVGAGEIAGWKLLPVPGAFIKLLSLDRQRGYAVLLGKLDPGTRYPAHVNVGPEDFCILTGDLHVSGRRLGPGDFHHADAGSQHEVNYSVDGCTLVAVLTADHPLVALAMA
jgi:anti-sigma factor ChrR (cupin superfamily)